VAAYGGLTLVPELSLLSKRGWSVKGTPSIAGERKRAALRTPMD